MTVGNSRSHVFDVQSFRGAWWLSPSVVFGAFGGLFLLLAAIVAPEVYSGEWDTPKAIDAESSALFGLATIALAGGAFAGSRLPLTGSSKGGNGFSVGILEKSFRPLLVLTVIGYIALTAVGAARGVSLSQLTNSLVGQDVGDGSIEETVGTVPGLTTLTQFGPACVVVGGLLFLRTKERHYIALIIVLLVLSVARAFFLTERAAVTELLVPLLVVMMWSTRPVWVRVVLPIVALPAGAALFGLFEYSRSWQTYRLYYGGSFFDFVLQRLSAYYATAFNNSAILLQHPPPVQNVPHATLAGFWEFPPVSFFDLEGRLNGYSYTDYYASVLYNYANPEFNNPGGFGSVFADWGIAAGLVVLMLFGYASGRLYTSYRTGSGVGTLLYPYWFVGVLEFPRLVFWTQGGVLPSLGVLLLLGIVAGEKRTDTDSGESYLPQPSRRSLS